MTGKKRALLICLPIMTAVLAGFLVWFFWPRQDDRVWFGEEVLSREETLSYKSGYNEVIQPLCRPALEGEDLLLYTALLRAYEQNCPSIRLYTEKPYTEEEVFTLLSMVKADYPNFFTSQLRDQFVIARDEEGFLTVEIPGIERQYIVDASFIETGREILAGLPDQTLGTGAGKEAARAYDIYCYLTDTVSYRAEGDTEIGLGDNFTLKGALTDGSAQCNGIAGAFQLLCELEDITCYKVFYRGKDVGREYGHVWNIVRLDGQWYHVDITAAVQFKQVQADYFAGEGMEPNIVIPDYFGRSDAETFGNTLRLNGIFDGVAPACPATLDKSPYYDLLVGDGEAPEDLVRKAGGLLADRQKETYPSLSIRFPDDDALTVFQQNLFGGRRYVDMLMENVKHPAEFHMFKNEATLYIYLNPKE